MLAGLRFIIVLPSLELGGAERQALLLARYLRETEGAIVSIWGLDKPGRVVEICNEYGLRCESIPFAPTGNRVMDCFRVALFSAKLRFARPDILLPYTLIPNILCGLVWKLTSAQLCVWNQRDEGFNLHKQIFYHRWAVRNTPFLFSNSTQGKEILINEFSVPPENVAIIRNGVELMEKVHDRGWWRDHLALCPDDILVCMVANLHKYKDHITLIKAWGTVMDVLAADGIHPRLILAGRYAGTEQQVVSTVAELGLQRSVTLLGQVDDISGLLDAADIGVFSSLSEGSPNGVLECMAAGLPVVATDIPGVRDAVGPLGIDWLAMPGDIEGLAKLIVNFARRADLRRKVGAANRKRVESLFSPRKMHEQTVDIINKKVAGVL